MTEDAIPAASLILMRERAAGPPELLVIRRSPALAFAGGAWVFPGGRVDPADGAGAAALLPGHDPADGAARLAALRETAEETGVDAGGDAAALVPFARWRPHGGVARRFDTRFYLARFDGSGDGDPVADGEEAVEALWIGAAALLARCGTGDGHAIFPTRRLLERLARFARFADAVADAATQDAAPITPIVERRADGDWLVIPAGRGYPVTAERLDRTRRD